jgi:ADP-ribosylglycohydrolase
VLGAVIGDIVGSIYEWHNIKTKDFPLFGEGCHFTDDTVITIATADALMNGGTKDDFINAYKKWGRMYPDAGYGGRFGSWICSDDREPYNSWGNGAAMRVAPCAWTMDCGFYARTGCWPSHGWAAVGCSAGVTHNHPEGIKGAEATALAIFLRRFYAKRYAFDYEEPWTAAAELKQEIRRLVENNFGYNLSRTLDEMRPDYRFNESCQETVPQAITAFLESTDFEDAIRNAISLGGDSDTLAAITGSIAEAAYGIPQEVKDKAWSYLDEPLRDVCRRWKAYLAEQ